MMAERSDITHYLVGLGFSSPGWLGVGIADLAKHPTTAPYIRELIELWERNRWWVSAGGTCKPIEPLRASLDSPTEKLAFLVGALRRREALEHHMKQTFDDSHCMIQLGNMRPLELCLDPMLQVGGTRFVLLDSKEYKYTRNGEQADDIGLVLGFIDIDWYDNTTLLVNVIQDHANALSLQKRDFAYDLKYLKISEGNKERNAITIISNRKKGIRYTMKRGRTRTPHPHASQTPGVEELLVYSVLELLATARVPAVSQVIIPKPEITFWGNVTDGEGTRTAAAKILVSVLSKNPPYVLQQLKEAFPEEWSGSGPLKPEDFAWDFCDLLLVGLVGEEPIHTYRLNTNGDTAHQKPLGQFLVECIVSAVPEDLRPSQYELASWGYYENFPGGVAQFRNCLYVLATRTPAYHRTFHAYRTAFADITRGDLSPTWGRTILQEDIARLPFAKLFRITRPNEYDPGL